MVCLWRLENNFVELVLSFHLYVSSRDQTHVARVYGNCLTS